MAVVSILDVSRTVFRFLRCLFLLDKLDGFRVRRKRIRSESDDEDLGLLDYLRQRVERDRSARSGSKKKRVSWSGLFTCSLAC